MMVFLSRESDKNQQSRGRLFPIFSGFILKDFGGMLIIAVNARAFVTSRHPG